MLNFTSDQWVIVALIFVLGLLVGGFLFSGGGRKWKQRYTSEVNRRTELEKSHTLREKEWREQDSLRTAAVKQRDSDDVRDRPIDARDNDHDRDFERDRNHDRDRDGVRDSRDPIDDRKL